MSLTLEAVDTYVDSIKGVRRLTDRDVRLLWRMLPDDPEDAIAWLLDVLPGFIASHGELASLAAVDFYDTVRDSDSFQAELIASPTLEQIEPSARWAVAPLFQEVSDNAGALGRLLTVADQLTINQSHETIFANGNRDPLKPRYARIPVGKTCAWCRMLASRGAVYRSEATAMRTSHADCDCKLTPFFKDDRLPYDRRELLAEYNAAARSAEGGSREAILSAMREQSGTH